MRAGPGAPGSEPRAPMDITLHNSLTRRREILRPLDPEHVRLYVCGPTVYDRPHIGNLRSNVCYDVLARLLRYRFARVTYVRNITDVDDKINARAAEAGLPIEAITARTIADFHADMATIGNRPPDVEPRATEHIAEMLAIIDRLLNAGYAYVAEGHVLFAVAAFSDYGALSGRSPEELLAGARVDPAPYKRDPSDFVLWKPAHAGEPGWDSPYGRGRPGWHIECSAMSWRYLGETFDIHGGGTDLIFPHHENERAQSLCAFPGSRFARVWLHNGMLRVNGEKMSKSLGNFFTLGELLPRAPAEAIRFLLLHARYSAVLDFTDAALAEARDSLDRFYRALDRVAPEADAEISPAVLAALADDLNTPAAIAALHALADAALAGSREAASALRASGGLLGILQQSPELWFRGGERDEAIEAAIAERLAARRARDFARADAIRAELAARGVVLEDGPEGTTWRRVALKQSETC